MHANGLRCTLHSMSKQCNFTTPYTVHRYTPLFSIKHFIMLDNLWYYRLPTTLPKLPVVYTIVLAIHTYETSSEHVTTGHFLYNGGLGFPNQSWLKHQRTTPRPPRPFALGHTEPCCCQRAKHQLRGNTQSQQLLSLRWSSVLACWSIQLCTCVLMVIMFIFHNKHHYCEQQKQVNYFIFVWTEMWTNIDSK